MISSIYNLSEIFYKLAAVYDQYRDKVEQLSKRNPYPFKSWFGPDGRTYIDFIPETGVDEYVEGTLKENGYEIVDYKKGFCKKNGKQEKINVVLEKLKNQQIQELEEQDKIEKILNLEYKKDKIIKFFNELIQTFYDSEYRRGKKESSFKIAISQNPHDVAKMSTDRGWKSCMELQKGEHREDVYREVESGGIVAYLIRPNDLDIQRPMARIHIRRFLNDLGENIAIQEETVYGSDIPGFSEAVAKWLKEKQPNITPGLYRRKGGEWSDSTRLQHIIPAQDPEELARWLKNIFPASPNKSTHTVQDNIKDVMPEDFIEQIENLNDFTEVFNTREEAEKYLESLKTNSDLRREYIKMNELSEQEYGEEISFDNFMESRFNIASHELNAESNFRTTAAEELLKMPRENLSPEVFQVLKEYCLSRSTSSDLFQNFAKKYPNEVPKEILKTRPSLKAEIIKSLPKEEQEEFIQDALNNFESFTKEMTIIISEMIPSEDGAKKLSDEQVANKLTDVSIEIFKKTDVLRQIMTQLQERTIRLLVTLGKTLLNLAEYYPNTLKQISQAISNIVHLFKMTGADTPVVQQFYSELMPLWNVDFGNRSDFGLHDLGIALAGLGINGHRFLPELKEKLRKVQEFAAKPENQKEFNKNRLEKIIEQYYYIIDSIESGTGRSKKYTFYH